MVPPGAVLRAAGHEVNRYGELLAAQLTGSVHPAVLLALHLTIGVVSAVPLALLVTAAGRGTPPILVATGAAYGAGYWLAVNATVLPLLYGRPHPWSEGLDVVWPSLLVHVVYGTVAAAVLGARGPRGQHGSTGASGRHRCGLCPLLRAMRRRRGTAPFVVLPEQRHPHRHALRLR